MRSTFEELMTQLDELRALVESIKPVNVALQEHTDSVVKRYVTIRRRFDYAAFAAALYASFEKFAEDLVVASAQLTAQRVPYASLPQKLLTKHLEQTADLLARGKLGAGRYKDLSELDVVKNLFDCLSGSNSYALNRVAVVAHDGNLRSSELNRLFAVTGIEHICTRIRRADAMLTWYCKLNDAVAPQNGLSEVFVDQKLDDIVERRNQVTHGGGSPSHIPSPEEMAEMINFIEAFCRSLFSMTVGSYLRDHHTVVNLGLHLHQKDDGPFKKGTVVVVDKPSRRLFVGQPIFAIVDADGARWGRIQSLAVDDLNVQAVEHDAVAPNGIGISLPFRCPRGVPLVALDADDERIWDPRETAGSQNGRL